MPKLYGRIVDGSYGFAVPKLCRRFGTVDMAISRQSCADDSETVAMAFPRQSCADGSYGCAVPNLCGRPESIAMALQRQSCADVSGR